MTLSKVAITGGSGFVGSSVAVHLSKRHEVKILDLNPPELEPNRNIEFAYCDVRNSKSVEALLADVDVVLHMAIIQIPRINDGSDSGYWANFVGTQNVCVAVVKLPRPKGLVLSSSCHVYGEGSQGGRIDEGSGLRPFQVEERAKLYVASKIAQEMVTRFFDEQSNKVFGVLRLGTVLGTDMSEKTAARIFIAEALEGKPITPYRHSLNRPMLYVDVGDVCKAYEGFVEGIITGRINKRQGGLDHVANVCWPKSLTLIDVARIVKEEVFKATRGRVSASIQIMDTKEPSLHGTGRGRPTTVGVERARKILGLTRMTNPRESIRKLVRISIAVKKEP